LITLVAVFFLVLYGVAMTARWVGVFLIWLQMFRINRKWNKVLDALKMKRTQINPIPHASVATSGIFIAVYWAALVYVLGGVAW
jgi:hypothetical protein